ncbi:hypothetical protein DET57_103263 [Klebsiella oxytoca]|uniref:Uncharacterized protein n=1 Tax=Klebsiella oxytoca TaxID=571 RepID=A0A318FZR2_KLEOX|nr:hypothetical protein DET57_103263 [Klebsiella oxytoca]
MFKKRCLLLSLPLFFLLLLLMQALTIRATVLSLSPVL